MLYELRDTPELENPVLVLGLEGWVDAGYGAAAALTTLLTSMETKVLAGFDDDVLLDHRSRRPVLHLSDGVNLGLTWPAIQLHHGQARTGRDVLVLAGPEPDLQWRAFTADVTDLATRLGVQLVVGLGAFPAPVPHTRPLRLAATASSPELAARIGFVGGKIDVPAGIHAALEEAFAGAGIPCVGVWARVPHYVAAMPYPAASAALLEKLAELTEIEVDVQGLQRAAEVTRHRVDELIANSEEHAAIVRQLESQHDAEVGDSGLGAGPLPSGDELAAELERFLRNEGGER